MNSGLKRLVANDNDNDNDKDIDNDIDNDKCYFYFSEASTTTKRRFRPEFITMEKRSCFFN